MRPRRARLPIILGSVLLAGAALAAGVTVVSFVRSSAAPTAPTTAEPAAIPSPSVGEVLERGRTEPLTVPNDGTTAVDLVNTSLQLVPVVRVGPDYPPAALQKGLEGSVTMKFRVTANGLVEDPTVVESSDSVFDSAALLAVSAWRYLPRIVAGKRTATADVHTTIHFRLPKPTTPNPAPPPTTLLNPLDLARQQQMSANVWERLMRDDLRGAELALDELRATYQLTDFQLGEIWNMYAYLYTLDENYDRAIEAYETAITAFGRSGLRQGRWVELANLYFARHQYDFALRTLLRSQPAESNPPHRWTSEATELIAKLRALGVTEETLR